MLIHQARYPSLQENPKLYLKNRAERLVRLVELDAPQMIIENEVKLVNRALEAYYTKMADKEH